MPADPVFVVHGGALSTRRKHRAGMDGVYRATLASILKAGYACLKKGGSALDAVETGIRLFEDSDLFDAGRGSVLNANGEVELDAAIMDGETLRAGAVAAVKRIRYPISASRMVMEKSGHVLLVADGAEQFVRDRDRSLMASPYHFYCKRRMDLFERNQSTAFGTVGAVALDRRGNLAAGTSTGGLELKKAGRVGDTPIIGAGTYADNATCAISCTGIGEYFMRTVAAHAAACLIRYKAASLQDAVRTVLRELRALGGRGGMIGVDRQGNVCLDFIHCAGMYRGCIARNRMTVGIFT